MAQNLCDPFYDPGSDLTGLVTEVGGVIGCRFAAIDPSGTGHPPTAVSDSITGGNVPVRYPDAGGDTIGVFGYNAAEDARVKVVRGPGKVVPILASGAIGAGDFVTADAVGKAIAVTEGDAVRGRCWRDVADGAMAMIELLP